MNPSEAANVRQANLIRYWNRNKDRTQSAEEYPLVYQYPVYEGYWYLVDNKPMQSPLTGTAADLAKHCDTKNIRRCDFVGRGLPER